MHFVLSEICFSELLKEYEISSESEKSINYTIFKRKWNHHDLFEQLPPNLRYSEKIENVLKKDENGFFYNPKTLKKEHKTFLLINPSIIDTNEFGIYLGSPLATGILRIANYLIKKGEKVIFYDFRPYSKKSSPRFVNKRFRGRNLYIYGKHMNNFTKFISKSCCFLCISG